MRRWQRLSRLFHHYVSRKEERCVLLVEQLEGRDVPAVIITDPTAFPFTYESTPFNAAILITISGDGFFSVFNSNPYEEGGQTYTATLTAPQGRLFINTDAAAASGISISQNGTSAVTLTGSLYAIDDLLRDQAFFPETETRIPNDIQFFPNANYSGDALVRLSVIDPETGSPVTKDSYVHVEPIPSPVIINVNAPGEVFAPASGFPLGNGFLTLSDWVDDDGSEQIFLNLSLSQPNQTGFTLIGRDGIINPDEGGAWQLRGNNPAEFGQLLNSLVLIPPAGFKGRVTLNTYGFLFDSASFPFSGTNIAQEPRYLLAPQISLRFFQGGNVALPPTFGQEGGTIDLGGRYTASNPDELPGDVHTLTLSVPNGTLTLNPAAAPAGLSVSRTVAADGGTTIVLQGTIGTINQFLATPGCMTYTAASPTFAGAVPLTVVLAIQPGPPPPPPEGEGTSFLAAALAEGQDPNSAALTPEMGPASRESFTGVVALSFIPVASRVFPSALDAVTNENTPVAVSIALTTLADVDGSESVLVILGGVPDGATFNRGTNLGGGQWLFSAADLLGLIFTPPPDTNGVFTLSVIATVADVAGVGSDSAAEVTAFTITVLESDEDTIAPPTPNTTDTTDTSTSSFLADDSDGDTDANANNRFDRDDGGNRENLEDGERDDSDREGDRPDGGRNPGRTLFAGTGGGGGGPGGPGAPDAVAGRPRFYSPTSGSPFVQTETAQTIYAGGEKHPLPPVLPLDQTLPVAGFSDSGGDSFALIDKIYRDANTQPAVAETVSVSLKLETEISEVKQAETVVIANANSTNSTNTPDVASGETPAEVREGEWRMWAAATTIASAVVAWVWLSRRTSWSPVRAIRRLFRIIYRRTPERAV